MNEERAATTGRVEYAPSDDSGAIILQNIQHIVNDRWAGEEMSLLAAGYAFNVFLIGETQEVASNGRERVAGEESQRLQEQIVIGEKPVEKRLPKKSADKTY